MEPPRRGHRPREPAGANRDSPAWVMCRIGRARKIPIIFYLAEENYEAFGRYAVEFVRRYQGKVGYLIIWNEPNLSLEWGFRPVDPASYVEMLKVVYPMVKAAAPEVQVLAGALAPTLDPPGSEWSMNELDYLQRMYDAGAADYFDILAIHAYGLGFEADEPAGESVVNFRRSELLREIMVRNGDSDKTAMITEGGWNDHPRWTRAVRPAQRILNSVQAYEIARTEWPWLESVSLWVFSLPLGSEELPGQLHLCQHRF